MPFGNEAIALKPANTQCADCCFLVDLRQASNKSVELELELRHSLQCFEHPIQPAERISSATQCPST